MIIRKILYVKMLLMSVATSLSFAFSISTIAQDLDYVPFDFSQGNVWENHYIEGNQGPPKFYPYIFYTSGRDTLIMNKKYHIIDYSAKYYGNKEQLFIREDTINKKLYVFDNNLDKTKERLFLDFNIYEGDSMMVPDREGIIKTKLKKKEKIFIAGKYRTKYFLGGARYVEFYRNPQMLPALSGTFRNNYLIEGIGSRVGLDITEYYVLIEGSAINVLRCYDKETIELTAFACSTLTDVEEGDYMKDALSLYPNPALDKLFIKTELMIRTYTVFDIRGTKVLETSANESLDVSALPIGLYLLEAINDQGLRFIQKFEKN